MNKKQYQQYLKSEDWKSVRVMVLKRDRYRCRVCNSGLDLNVHHRTYEFIGREMENLTDLITLCLRCHGLFHGKTEEEKAPPKKTRKEKRPECEKKKGVRVEMILERLENIQDPPFEVPERLFLTNDWIERLRTEKGSFTSASMKTLGVCMKESGWGHEYGKTEIRREQFLKAWRGRNVMAAELKALNKAGVDW